MKKLSAENISYDTLQVFIVKIFIVVAMMYNGNMSEGENMPSKNDYQKLGHRALWFFMFERGRLAMLALLLSLVTLILINNAPESYVVLGFAAPLKRIVVLAALVFLILFAVSLLGAVIAGFLAYINYKFFLSEDAFKIKRGILSTEEIAIPYRQIQDVNIRRDVLFMTFGLSKLIIQSAGHEDKGDEGESEAVLPAIDKDMGEKLREELLRRANIEKVAPTTEK